MLAGRLLRLIRRRRRNILVVMLVTAAAVYAAVHRRHVRRLPRHRNNAHRLPLDPNLIVQMGWEGRQRLVLAKALHGAKNALIQHEPTLEEDVLRTRGHLHPLVDIEVALALLVGQPEGLLQVAESRIPDDNVGVRADGHFTLLRIQIEQLGGQRGGQRDELGARNAAGFDSFVPEEEEAFLHAGDAEGDGGEGVLAERLLFGVVCGVLGRHHLQVRLGGRGQERLALPLPAEERR